MKLLFWILLIILFSTLETFMILPDHSPLKDPISFIMGGSFLAIICLSIIMDRKDRLNDPYNHHSY